MLPAALAFLCHGHFCLGGPLHPLKNKQKIICYDYVGIKRNTIQAGFIIIYYYYIHVFIWFKVNTIKAFFFNGPFTVLWTPDIVYLMDKRALRIKRPWKWGCWREKCRQSLYAVTQNPGSDLNSRLCHFPTEWFLHNLFNVSKLYFTHL